MREKARALRDSTKVGKNMPKAQYSKIPVSVVKHIKGRDAPKAAVVRDPRFENSSGTLNQGLFEKSYSFISEVQQERMQTLRNELRQAKKNGDEDARQRIKELLGEEKGFMNSKRGRQEDKQQL